MEKLTEIYKSNSKALYKLEVNGKEYAICFTTSKGFMVVPTTGRNFEAMSLNDAIWRAKRHAYRGTKIQIGSRTFLVMDWQENGIVVLKSPRGVYYTTRQKENGWKTPYHYGRPIWFLKRFEGK